MRKNWDRQTDSAAFRVDFRRKGHRRIEKWKITTLNVEELLEVGVGYE